MWKTYKTAASASQILGLDWGLIQISAYGMEFYGWAPLLQLYKQ